MEMVLQPRGAAGASTTTMKQEKKEEEEAGELRRGPWTVDEDLILINYIAEHGEGRWNALARAAGLNRTGKSCRLRWLNYLRPDVKRGDFTADEQLLILDLHSRWGNRWSKIAQQLPGRTDNEIKNYWRTRVQKHARQLNCDVNSRRFKDAMTYLWMPRLAERAAASHLQSQQQQPHSMVVNSGNGANSSSPAATPAAYLAAETNNSPGGGSSSCVVPSSSSSDSSSTESSAHEEKSVLHLPDHHHHSSSNNGGRDCCWTTTMLQGADHEFWSTTMQELTTMVNGDNSQQHQFQEDLITGWVQGFSEGISDNSLWSLDDIWRMQ